METAGQFHTSLAERLGIRQGTLIHVVNPPAHYVEVLQPLPLEVSIIPGRPLERVDFLHLFVTREDELRHELVSLVDVLLPEGTLWISWPKQSSGITTNVTEDTLRDHALPLRLVDSKLCAIDDTWSALKFVWRKERRRQPRR